jgi:putative membrane protein
MKMATMFATGLLATVIAGGVSAQGSAPTPSIGSHVPAATMNQTPATTAAPNPSAVQTNNTASRTASAPVPGHNSFTMGEARRRIQASGFSQVSELKRDNQGIWRGQAQKDGHPVSVALDYQGNVVGQ